MMMTKNDTMQLISTNPSTGQVLWKGAIADEAAVNIAVLHAKAAFADWSLTPLQERIALLERYAVLLGEHRDHITDTIIREAGKVRREARAEASALIGKIAISIEAYQTRTGSHRYDIDGGARELNHRPLGVMAVFGPYNFPMHLPNGHIVPALLAGNTIVFKPSDQTPMCGELLVNLMNQAGFPSGVLNLVQGGVETGVALCKNPTISGVLFTGSYATGKKIHEALAGRPEVMLALEMGGNNPLIVSHTNDIEATARLIIDSAYSQAGQRCTCTRRLIVIEGEHGNRVIAAVAQMIDQLRISDPFEMPEPYIGPMINNVQAQNVMDAQTMLVGLGGKPLKQATRLVKDGAFITPALIDMTNVENVPDEEVFGSLLCVYRVENLDHAITLANDTNYGLSAGLLSDVEGEWDYVAPRLRAGVLNYNRPTNGAVSGAPFGGPGHSGNYRPSAYYAADYCAYPVSSLISQTVTYPALVGVKGT